MGTFSHIFKKDTQSKDKQFERSNTYRKDYLAKHKGIFGLYCCSYCGKICTRSGMQVDHIFPVNGVKNDDMESLWGRMFISLIGFFHGPQALKDGVNADWNKTSACPRCNGNKTDNKGIWLLRGYLGKVIFPIMNIYFAVSICYGMLATLITGSSEAFKKTLIIAIVIKIILYVISVKTKRK